MSTPPDRAAAVPDPLPPRLAALLDGLDGTAASARAQLLRDLLASGHSPDELVAAHAEDRLALLPVTDALRTDGTRTIDEIAEEYGLDPEWIVLTRRALGLSVARTAAVYGAALERHAERLRGVLDAGLSVESLIAFNYVIGSGAAAIAGGALDVTQTVLESVDPQGTEHSRAVLAADLAMRLTPVLTDVVTYAVEEHLREAARHEVTSSLVADHAGRVSDVTIAFADLVGFTALGDAVGPDDLGAVAMRLERIARDSLAGDTDLVKTLGDAVMLSARRQDDVLDTVTALIAATAEDPVLPQLRVGIAHGPGLHRAGDWYGSVVNRASRLTALAEPDQVIADAAVRSGSSVTSGRWDDLGLLSVRGLAEPVRCWSLLPS